IKLARAADFGMRSQYLLDQGGAGTHHSDYQDGSVRRGSGSFYAREQFWGVNAGYVVHESGPGLALVRRSYRLQQLAGARVAIEGLRVVADVVEVLSDREAHIRFVDGRSQ